MFDPELWYGLGLWIYIIVGVECLFKYSSILWFGGKVQFWHSNNQVNGKRRIVH